MDDLYINGNWVEGKGSKIDSENPHNKRTLYETRAANVDQTEKAIRKASEAQSEWKDKSMIERADYLWDIFHELRNNVESLGEIVSMECGKEISEGKADVTEAFHMVEFAAGLSRHSTEEVVPSEIASKDSYILRKPKGTIGCITPWNFPIAIPCWHICIPLVYGNTIVFKPSEETPYCGKKVAELFSDLPDGVFNMIQGEGYPVGNKIAESKELDVVQFTGSAEVGWKINRKAGEYYGKTAACEMGGKNAVILTDKADMDIGLKASILSSFKTTGQRCVSSERIIVHSDIYEEFKEQFVDISKNLKIGNPLDEETFMGPLINKKQLQKFNKYNEKVRNDPETNILVDKTNLDEKDGYYTGPFIYEAEWSDKDFLKEEVFGPHVSLIKYEGDVNKAIEINNDVDYGLAGSIITEDYRQWKEYMNEAELGLAYTNLACIGAEVQLPFGGVKKSGNGNPSAKGIIEFCTDKMAFTVNNNKDIKLSQGLSSDINTDN